VAFSERRAPRGSSRLGPSATAAHALRAPAPEPPAARRRPAARRADRRRDLGAPAVCRVVPERRSPGAAAPRRAVESSYRARGGGPLAPGQTSSGTAGSTGTPSSTCGLEFSTRAASKGRSNGTAVEPATARSDSPSRQPRFSCPSSRPTSELCIPTRGSGGR
jgi:hypothetical protein